jgi:hypothetical protein
MTTPATASKTKSVRQRVLRLLDSIPKSQHRKEQRMGARKGKALLFAVTIFVLSVAAHELYAADKTSLELSRDTVIHIVTQIQRADYEGDRPALKRLHDELTPIPEDKKLASQVLYWRGFALWRRAINGFNESPTPTDLEEDLAQAVTDFKDAIARDPAFVEPKIGAGSSLGYLMYLNRKDPTRVQELLQYHCCNGVQTSTFRYVKIPIPATKARTKATRVESSQFLDGPGDSPRPNNRFTVHPQSGQSPAVRRANRRHPERRPRKVWSSSTHFGN